MPTPCNIRTERPALAPVVAAAVVVAVLGLFPLLTGGVSAGAAVLECAGFVTGASTRAQSGRSAAEAGAGSAACVAEPRVPAGTAEPGSPPGSEPGSPPEPDPDMTGAAGLDLDDPGEDSGGEAGSDAADPVWDELARCESSGDWSIDTGNGYSGGLQFDDPTWQAYGGAEFAPRANQATREQQIAVATKVRDDRGGYGSSPACANKLGLPR